MFDRTVTARDEIRFTLFKYKVKAQGPKPALDYEYVVHKIEAGQEYGYKARVVWKPFVSPEDCLDEYQKWAAAQGRPQQ